MAEPYDPGLLPRTYFRAPRVPFDFRALLIAVLGFLVYYAGGRLISSIMAPAGAGGTYDVPGAFLSWALHLFGGLPYIGDQIANLLHGALRIDAGVLSKGEYGWLDYLVGGAWFVGVWSFFAQGIHRITTMRIARDEGMPIVDALKFSAKNWPTVALAPVIVAGTIAIFYLCNLLGALLTAIPFVGGILSLIIVPLQFVATLLMLLIGLGGVFGMPLIGAAAAWECNGSLDAISRAFSYLFARPLQYFWNFFLIFLFTGVILLVGSWFTYTFAKSVDAGTWHDTLSIAIDPPAKKTTEDSDYANLEAEARGHLESLEKKGAVDEDLVMGRDVDAPRIKPPVRDIQTVGELPFKFKLNALVLWAMFNFIWLGVSGYALYWLLGASTSVYADLRADVDGTEEDEVYIEEEEDDLDALAEDGPAVESEAATPPAPAPEPASDAPTAGGDAPASDAPDTQAPDTRAPDTPDAPSAPEGEGGEDPDGGTK